MLQPAALWPYPAMFSGNYSIFSVASITRQVIRYQWTVKQQGNYTNNDRPHEESAPLTHLNYMALYKSCIIIITIIIMIYLNNMHRKYHYQQSDIKQEIHNKTKINTNWDWVLTLSCLSVGIVSRRLQKLSLIWSRLFLSSALWCAFLSAWKTNNHSDIVTK